MKTYYFIGIIFILLAGYICQPLFRKKEDPEKILNVNLARHKIVPKKDVYYIVDSKTNTIRIVNKPLIMQK